ncbi:unnamed protein product [Gongylonema pulchrum]|uniref:NPH3 domain-containing protein n=1 Tax=Gongylonema pulchrum TaxID=637853 RepID=A0A183EIP8_9BILA|nr:unnamed protein product [Gongylonema pulchrum]
MYPLLQTLVADILKTYRLVRQRPAAEAAIVPVQRYETEYDERVDKVQLLFPFLSARSLKSVIEKGVLHASIHFLQMDMDGAKPNHSSLHPCTTPPVLVL